MGLSYAITSHRFRIHILFSFTLVRELESFEVPSHFHLQPPPLATIEGPSKQLIFLNPFCSIIRLLTYSPLPASHSVSLLPLPLFGCKSHSFSQTPDEKSLSSEDLEESEYHGGVFFCTSHVLNQSSDYSSPGISHAQSTQRSKHLYQRLYFMEKWVCCMSNLSCCDSPSTSLSNRLAFK